MRHKFFVLVISLGFMLLAITSATAQEHVADVIAYIACNQDYSIPINPSQISSLKWSAKWNGNGFIHTPASGVPGTAHPDNVMRYLTWDGSCWEARWDGNTKFVHKRVATGQEHSDTVLNYFTWDLGKWSATREGNNFHHRSEAAILRARLTTPQPRTTNGVRIFGDFPSTGFCDATLYASAGVQGHPNGECNDTTSAVDVPFGMSIKLCEHDGQGSSGFGKCRTFLPGITPVGEEFNDKATSYFVEKRMIGYLNSGDFASPINIFIGVSIDSQGTGGQGTHPATPIGWRSYPISQEYTIPLPASCLNPKVIETTKNGDSSWYSYTKNNVLFIGLEVKPHLPLSGRNWVGVEILCPIQ